MLHAQAKKADPLEQLSDDARAAMAAVEKAAAALPQEAELNFSVMEGDAGGFGQRPPDDPPNAGKAWILFQKLLWTYVDVDVTAAWRATRAFSGSDCRTTQCRQGEVLRKTSWRAAFVRSQPLQRQQQTKLLPLTL